MKRRAFLSTVGGIYFAGCSSESPTTESSPSRTDTGTPTESPTPSPAATPSSSPVNAPNITRQSLLTHWQEYGDVEENGVEALGKGGNAVVGWRYSLPIHDGKSKELVQVTIYESGGPSVTSRKETEEYITNQTGSESWERWFGFDTTNWEMGNYTAEIVVRDEISGKNSGDELVEFSLNEPFSKGDVAIQNYAPDTVSVGEESTLRITFSNTTNRDSSLVSKLSARYENSDWQPVSDSKMTLNMAANGTRTFEGSPASFDQAGEYTYRINDIGETFTIEVTE